MKHFISTFIACSLAALVVVGGSIMLIRPYFILTAIAAHKAVDGPGEAKRLIMDLTKMQPEEVDQIVLEIYTNSARVRPAR